MSIIENYRRIREEIDTIALSCGRKAGDVRIIAVSKTISEAVVQDAIDTGISIFGENKVQEAKRKIPELSGDFAFHMIGHLQSNKARDAVRLFDLIHSIDTWSTAERVNAEAASIGKMQKILIQVNASGEESKSGIDPESIDGLVSRVMECDNLEIRGLMTMAPFTDDVDVIRNCFRTAGALMDKIYALHGVRLRDLSMGMSSDYRIAVEEGSTMVRIGTALFGNR
ncbi:MAG: YggS family pyridoxal phosphate-dependent enzyme [Chrysiogenales bacterium]|nr:MAG: YggS family pyridoxal phosphate-dependent enzyme [Chrysiogenales bacterium]